LALAVIAASFCLFSQTKISSGSTNIDVQIKRAVVNGDDVFVDLIITSRGSWSFLEIMTRNDMGSVGCRFYDDEGNLYQSGSSSVMQFEIDGARSYWFPKIQIERDIPRKMRIIVKNVDEYASSFSSIRIPYWGNGGSKTEDLNVITIKNLPIIRD